MSLSPPFSIIPLAKKARAKSQRVTQATSWRKKSFREFALGKERHDRRVSFVLKLNSYFWALKSSDLLRPPNGETENGQSVTFSDVIPSQLKVTIIFQLIFQAPLPILAQRFSEIQGPNLLRLQLAKSRWGIEPLEHWTDGGLSSLAQQAGHSNNMITESTALGSILLGWGSAPLLLENRRRQDTSHKTEGRSDKGAAWLSSRRHLVTPCLANLSNAGKFKAETAVWSGEWASPASSLLLVMERWKLRNQSVRSETGPYPRAVAELGHDRYCKSYGQRRYRLYDCASHGVGPWSYGSLLYRREDRGGLDKDGGMKGCFDSWFRQIRRT